MKAPDVIDEVITLLNQVINDLFQIKRKLSGYRRFQSIERTCIRVLRLLNHESVPSWVREEFQDRLADFLDGH